MKIAKLSLHFVICQKMSFYSPDWCLQYNDDPHQEGSQVKLECLIGKILGKRKISKSLVNHILTF